MFKEISTNYPIGDHILEDFPEEEYKLYNSFINLMQDLNKNEHEIVSKDLLDFYLEVNRFMKISEFFNERYLAYYGIKDDIKIHLFCLDASYFISSMTNRLKGSVFFLRHIVSNRIFYRHSWR